MIDFPNKILKSIQFLDDVTVEIVFNDHIVIDVDDIKKTFDDLLTFTNNKRVKKLLIIGSKTQITKEARMYGHEFSMKLKHLVIAEAIVVNAFYQKLVINLYARFIKESYPTRYFTDFEKAKDWLKTF